MNPLIINGIDFTALANRSSYTVEYEKRTGPNAGMMLDGSLTEDVLAIKAVISWSLNSMTAHQLNRLLAETLSAYPYVTVTYFEPRMNAPRTAEFIPTVGALSYAFTRHGADYYRDGTTLTLRER